MADITMCVNDDCPLAKTCYRHEAKPTPGWQSIQYFKGGEDCPDYWAVGKDNKRSAKDKP